MTAQADVFSILADRGGFGILKNGILLKTPRRNSLTVPSSALAHAVVHEFTQQGDKKDLRAMPLTQMALTTLDVTTESFTECVEDIMRYGKAELVCQRATDPAALIEEQNKVWQPYLDWCAAAFGANLCTGSGILPVAQDPKALAALRLVVAAQDPFLLTGLKEACHTFGSLVLGLALLKGKASAAEAFEAAELDALWQLKQWGDDEAAQKRLAAVRKDADLCASWFALLQGAAVP
ncbi:MAG: ATPase [Alphaproteobacteria bacterium]|nr:ATPase [Alphaproteobacteria bacterium]